MSSKHNRKLWQFDKIYNYFLNIEIGWLMILHDVKHITHLKQKSPPLLTSTFFKLSAASTSSAVKVVLLECSMHLIASCMKVSMVEWRWQKTSKPLITQSKLFSIFGSTFKFSSCNLEVTGTNHENRISIWGSSPDPHLVSLEHWVP